MLRVADSRGLITLIEPIYYWLVARWYYKKANNFINNYSVQKMLSLYNESYSIKNTHTMTNTSSKAAGNSIGFKA